MFGYSVHKSRKILAHPASLLYLGGLLVLKQFAHLLVVLTLHLSEALHLVHQLIDVAHSPADQLTIIACFSRLLDYTCFLSILLHLVLFV